MHEYQAAHITCGRKPWFNASEKLFPPATVRRTHKILFSVLTPPDEIVHARIRKASKADCDTAVSVGTICEGVRYAFRDREGASRRSATDHGGLILRGEGFSYGWLKKFFYLSIFIKVLSVQSYHRI